MKKLKEGILPVILLGMQYFPVELSLTYPLLCYTDCCGNRSTFAWQEIYHQKQVDDE